MIFYKRNDGQPALDGASVTLRPVKAYETLHRLCEEAWTRQTRDRTQEEALDPEWNVRPLMANVWAIRDPKEPMTWGFYTTKNVEVL